MSTINISTTQNVAIQYKKAPVSHRIVATIIDVFLFFTVIFVLGSADAIDIIPEDLQNYVLYFIALLFFCYPLLWETFTEGRSPGKMVFKIRVVSIDGTPASIGSYFIRWLIGLFEIPTAFGAIAIIAIIASKNGQRLGDMAAKTTVIIDSKKVTLEDIAVVTTHTATPEIPQAALLSTSDISTIREVLEASKKYLSPEQASEMQWLTAEKLANKLGTGEVSSAEEYLEALLRSHYTLNS